MNQHSRNRLLTLVCTLLFVAPSIQAYDLSKEKVCYEVAGAHLDDQWNWTLGGTLAYLIPGTLHKNFAYIAQYPEYKFNFEGAFRYWTAKKFGGAQPASGTDYKAHDYDTLKNYIQQGRWIPNGALWSSCDVNVPSAEALIRQILYGQTFFKDEFGVKSNDIYLPDCFGFGYALPTIAAHCGLKGFSTQKLDWGASVPIPFSIGRWIGVDGSSIIASLKPGNYGNGIDIRTADGDSLRAHTLSFTNGPGNQPGIWATQDYIGTGDMGGGPATADVSAMITRIQANGSNAIKMYSTSSGQIYDDLTAPMVAALPSYDGELLLKQHGNGCYTAWAPMKTKNRRNEQRAALAEFACVAANCLTNGTFAYPADTIRHGWWRFLAHQFHDDLTGTSIADAYRIYSLPAEDSAFNDFNYALGLGNNAAANSGTQAITTTASAADGRIPLVLVNPLATARADVVEATVDVGGTAPAGVKVYAPSGAEVPAQIIGSSGTNVTVAFIANVSSASYSAYEVKPVTQANPVDPALTVNAATGVLENAYYKVQVDQNGDISSIMAKQAKSGGQELLTAPSRLELRPDQGTGSPAWEIQYSNCSAVPTYVTENVQKTVAENGPARVALKVTRFSGTSQFTQYIRLASGEAGKIITVYNEINWLNAGTLLKVGFPLTCTNPNATWDLGIGTIQRPNMNQNRYEVPGQQWADMTSIDGSYGVSILNNCKYGWNKENLGKLNLTLIHSPSPSGNYLQDLSSVAEVGIHKFTYAIYGHAGTWTNGTVAQGRCLNQPIYAFQAQPHAGTLTARTVSLMSVDTSQVDIMAMKKAEKSGNYIIRVRETMGKSLSNARLTFAKNIISAIELSGAEDTVSPASPLQISGTSLSFSLARYMPRTFSVNLGGVVSTTIPAASAAFAAGKNITVVFASAGRTLKTSLRISAGEKIPVVSISDARGRLVRHHLGQKNGTSGAFVWDGTDMSSRKVCTGTYFVTCVAGGARASARLAVTW